MKEILSKLANRIRRMRTSTMVSFFILLGFLFLFIETIMFSGYSGQPIENVLIPLTFFFWGLAGLPIIIRQEANFYIFSLHGLPAVLLGMALLLFGFVAVLVPVIGFISK